MNVGQRTPETRTSTKLSILLMDANSERRALRKKIMALHRVEVVGACDLTEASSIWHRDRYDMVLMDVRRDYRGCLAWRDEIKKENPKQIVAFLIGKPEYIALQPLEDSFVAEQHGTQWGDSLRLAIRKSCESLPQRNSFAEAGWRITAARKISGADKISKSTEPESDLITDANQVVSSPTASSTEPGGTWDAEGQAPQPIGTPMENE
jgi:CheY-like chemotaxis protein